MSKVAFIFPGQGSQKVGMGKEFYDQTAIGKEIFEKAEAVTGLDMKRLCFEENNDINITEYTQVCLVTASVAIMNVVLKKGIRPDVAAGLSLGEYAALVATGAMRFEDAAKAVRKRGIYMQEEVPAGVGAMAAVMNLDAETIEKSIAGIPDVGIANYNCPGQIVVSGKKEAVLKAVEQCKEAGARRCVMLNVSGPFHSKLLTGAGDKLAAVLDEVVLQEPKIPYVANVTASYIMSCEEIKPLLIQQVSSSVKWEQSILAMVENGVDTFIEIGPGKTLNGFNKKIAKKIGKELKTFNIETLADVDAVVKALQA